MQNVSGMYGQSRLGPDEDRDWKCETVLTRVAICGMAWFMTIPHL